MIFPHDDAPLHVWHAWLCHGARTDGSGGDECPDGCDGSGAHESFRERLAAYSLPDEAVAS